MHYSVLKINYRREVGFLLVVNLTIASLITLLAENEHFFFNLLVSNCIGFLMWGLTSLLCHWQKSEKVAFWHVMLCMPMAVFLGFTLASIIWPGIVPERMPASDLALQLRKFAMMAIVTISAGSLFYYRYNHQRDLTKLEAERRRTAELQQAETAARLAMLQAQIEPHFLFNTLATVRSLISIDAARAEYTLDQLNDYLRASLTRTRQPNATLADELALIHPLLEIARIRMGERLRYHINIPDTLLATPLPPLLLQPLVENALEHGIEPAIHGGTLDIAANLDGDVLQLTVTDSGMGLGQGNADGVGLANVRQRLAAIYGERAQLALYPNQPQGVIARLQIPIQGNAP